MTITLSLDHAVLAAWMLVGLALVVWTKRCESPGTLGALDALPQFILLCGWIALGIGYGLARWLS